MLLFEYTSNKLQKKQIVAPKNVLRCSHFNEKPALEHVYNPNVTYLSNRMNCVA